MRLRPSLSALAALACVLLAVRAARAERSVLHDTNLVVDSVLVPEAEATAYVEVRGATALRESHPVGGADVSLRVRPLGGEGEGEDEPGPGQVLATARTDGAGRALLRFRVPRLSPGRYQLLVATRSRHGSGELVSQVEIAESAHLHLRTDRPVYRAGQPLRWRATLLSAANAHPLADSEIEVVIEDERGTAIWRGRETTDASGMVAGELPLSEDLELGDYTVRASARGAEARETVEVKAFVLPPFEVAIETDGEALEPGGTVRGQVVARYHYGEPVRGKVRIHSFAGAVKTGALDASGRFSFALPIGDGQSLRLSAVVTDGAGRRRRVHSDLPLPADELQMALIPELQTVAAGESLWVTVITTDGRGELVPATVSVSATGQRRQLRRSPGAVRVRVRAPKTLGRWDSMEIRASASTEDARVASAERTLRARRAGPRIRPVRAVVAAGAPVELRGRWPDRSGPVVVTLVRDGAPLASTVTVPAKGGALSARIQPPPGLFGLFTVRVSDLDWDRSSGTVTPRRADATVYLRPKELDVAIDGPLRHGPGDTARLAVQVRDAAGAPVGGAALAASVVDERILALGEARPDLVAAVRALGVGDARAAGIAFASLLTQEGSGPRRLAMRALLESLPPEQAEPRVTVAAAARLRAEIARLNEARETLLAHLVAAGAVAERAGTGWRYRRELHEHLAAVGWEPARQRTPWQRPTSWRYAVDVVPELALEAFTVELGTQRLDALAAEIIELPARAQERLLRDPGLLVGVGIAPGLLVDPWGQAITAEAEGDALRLRSAGLDGRPGTHDDLVHADAFSITAACYGSGVGGIGHGRGAGGGQLRVGNARNSDPLAAKVRRRFDETVLWVAGVRTDAAGRAELEVPLADSITGWKVAVEAVGGAGGIGAAAARLETFLPVHVDAEIPHALTIGDRYSIPVAVANHSGAAQRFELEARVSGPATLVGPARQTIEARDGAAAPVYVGVRATGAGEAVLRLSLRAGGRSVDELERRIELRAPGLVVRELSRGDYEAGRGAIDFEIPAEHARGSARATLTLFRGASDVALDGLEGMLAEPHGCFEQTSSTTHPNLLVLELLKGRPGAAAITARARELVAKGYQRLISYEVRGGGFSWFGEAPANQILTAYGLLEFADMSRVYPVDPKLIERTRAWLLSKQRGDGSWQPDAEWLHDWSAVQGRHSTTAYIAWALAESGYRGKGLRRALAYLRRHRAALERSPYLVSLWAAAEAAAKTRDRRALTALRRAASRDGAGTRYSAGGTTLFYARGDAADVQVTALAAAALHRRSQAGDAERALEWLWSARNAGGWGSTQSTVLALRAAALTAAKEDPPSGRVQVEFDGQVVGALDLDAAALPTLELAELAAGKHALRLRGPDGSLRADLRLRWRQKGEPRPVQRGLAVSLTPPLLSPTVGSLAPFSVRVHNPGGESVAMPVVVVPVPPGFRADPASLQKLEQSNTVERAEDRGSEIAFYLRELGSRISLTLPYQLEAIAACEVMQAPARAYAYYSPELGGSSAARRIEVVRQRRWPLPSITALRSPPAPVP